MSPEPFNIEKISVFGLGKLGACISAALANRGFRVIGYDVDKRKTEAVKKGLAPVEEPHLEEFNSGCRPSLKGDGRYTRSDPRNQKRPFLCPLPQVCLMVASAITS